MSWDATQSRASSSTWPTTHSGRCGCRSCSPVYASEALGLRWGDFDETSQTLSIQRALVAVEYEVQLSQPKTSKGRRQVALEDRVSASPASQHKTRHTRHD